jgi:anti-sigma regulatory factor (Ser/Thr protein kinase)
MNVLTTTRFRRERSAVRSARAFVRHALRPVSTLDAAERLELATAEACNNAILHAGGSAFTVSVEVDDGRAVVTVSDDGVGFELPERVRMPTPHDTGHRGLPLMHALVDDVEVSCDGRGTTVVLALGLSDEGADRGARVTVDS